MTSRRRSRRLFPEQANPWALEEKLVAISGERDVFVVSLSNGWEDVAGGISGDLGAPGETVFDLANSNDRWEDGVGILGGVRNFWRRVVGCSGDVAMGISEGISGASWIREVAVKRLVVGCISRGSWNGENVVKRLIVVWKELLGDWRIGSTPWRRVDVAEGLAVGSEDVWLASVSVVAG